MDAPRQKLRMLLYSSAASRTPGGVQAVFCRLAASLRQRGHQVIVAWPEPDAEYLEHEWYCDLEYRTGWLGLPGLGALLRAGRGLLGLAGQLARYHPEIVNVHYVRGDSLYFLLLQRLFGYRLVLSVHGSDLLLPGKPAPYLLPRADAVTVVSRHMEQRVLACAGITASRVRCIPNGIDQDFWRAGPAVATDGPPTVVFVGRLLQIKGVDVLLTAFARLRERLPAARLCVIGEGELRGALEARVAGLGIADGVTFTGELDAIALREQLARASLFVLPSHSEGLPMALLEAMAAGLPAVASAVGGIPEVLTPECGRLVAPGDPEALADALMALLQAPEREAMGEAARQRAAAFSSSAADASYERLFLELRAGVL